MNVYVIEKIIELTMIAKAKRRYEFRKRMIRKNLLRISK